MQLFTAYCLVYSVADSFYAISYLIVYVILTVNVHSVKKPLIDTKYMNTLQNIRAYNIFIIVDNQPDLLLHWNKNVHKMF